MDETTQTKTSDVAALATRKRRSSILKSQRPPRTPFCELEFNVCTPTDTSKSRRVSFSRRTDVAEFATNEATTTWKNFYEEQNKCLESSGTDSDANDQKQLVGHPGKRNFDQMFDKVEAVDCIGSLNPEINISTSINNFNFTQVESTDSNLTAPQKKFELSAFTEQQSKLFGDDLNVACTGEVTDGIDVNFSTVQPIGGNDDLDEIQKDLQRQSEAGFCRGTFSEYIEVDLDVTHVEMNNRESDMSITDTIDIPNVQDVSKSCSIDKKVNVEKDWLMNKENIAINPYIAPRESVNFAINEEPDKVLVFDGKKLIMQTEKENYRQTLLPNTFEVAPQRKTIVLNCNDDLPNFIDNAQVSKYASGFVDVSEIRRGVIFDGDMSITQPRLGELHNMQRNEIQQKTELDDDFGNISVNRVLTNVIVPDIEKRRKLLYENDTGNISITQAISSNIYNDNHDKNKTVVYENEACDISMTRVIPVKIIAPDNTANKRRTIVFENDNGNLSITQAIPNVLIKESTETRRTVVYEDKTDNIIVSQAISSNESLTQKTPSPERRRTVIFENDIGNMSVTQGLPSNILIPQKLNEQHQYEDDTNISIVPTKILLADNVASNRLGTVLYEVETNHISITQSVTSNKGLQGLTHKQLPYIEPCQIENVHGNNEEKTNKSRAVIKRNDIDISMTQSIKLNQMRPGCINKQPENLSSKEVNKRMTIVFDNDAADISVTQAVHMNQVIEAVNEQKQKEIDLIESSYAALHKQHSTVQKIPVTFEIDDADVSIPAAVKLNQALQGFVNYQKENISHNDLEVATNTVLHFHNDTVGRTNTFIHADDENNLSMTQAISANVILPKEQKKIKINNEDVDSMMKMENVFPSAAIPSKEQQTRRTIIYEDVDAKIKNEDLFVTEAVPSKQKQKRRTAAYEDAVLENKDLFMEIDKLTNCSQDKNEIELDVSSSDENRLDKSKRNTSVDEHEMSITQEIVQQVSPKEIQNKRRSVVFHGIANNVVSKPIPAGLFALQSEIFEKSLDKNMLARDSMLENLTNVSSDIIVYNAETVSAQSLQKQELARTENDDVKTENTDAFPNEDEKDTSAEVSYGLEQISHSSMKTKIQIPTNEQTKVETDVHNQKSNKALEEPKLSASSVRETLDRAVEMPTLKAKSSILSTLLDMSYSSVEDMEDKIVITENISESSPRVSAEKPKIEFSKDVPETERLFFITKDIEEDVEPEETDKKLKSEAYKREKTKKLQKSKKLETPNQSVEPKDKKEPALNISVIQKELLEDVLKSDQSSNKNDSFGTGSKEYLDMSKKELLPKSGKSFRMANNTNELLEMISDFTDRRKSRNLDPPLEEDEEIPESDVSKGQLALEYKKKISEPEMTRNSFVSKRHSIVLSREDLINNLSMAAAALQKSRFELDETDVEDTAKKSPDPDVPLKNTARMSTEIVKTLNFEDSSTDIPIQTDAFQTSLKKTAFGEITYMKETKAKVIPDYLKNVSDGVKELMDDLVKPIADVLPFNATITNKGVKNSASTCSNQIQTNLLTSSQVDLNTELYSSPESEEDMPNLSLDDIITDAVDRSVSLTIENPVKSSPTLTQSEKSLQIESHDTDAGSAMAEVPIHRRVLIFDHDNPLNNVLLMPPIDTMEVHKYNPVQSTESINVTGQSTIAQLSDKQTQKDSDPEVITTHYLIQSKLGLLADNSSYCKKADVCSFTSDSSKTFSTDRSTDRIENEYKNIEVNTVIAMKGNKELLEASSSLTLVEEPTGMVMVQGTFDGGIDSRNTSSLEDDGSSSPVEVLYKVEELQPEKLDSDLTSNEVLSPANKSKPKKRGYSPTRRDKHKHCTVSMLDVTPKPVSKVAKHSYDLIQEKPTKLSAEKDQSELHTERRTPHKKSPEKSKHKKPGTTITVQQMMTMVHVESVTLVAESTSAIKDLESVVNTVLRDPMNGSSAEPRTQTVSQMEVQEQNVAMTYSFTSSKNLKDDSHVTSKDCSPSASKKCLKTECVQNIGTSGISTKCPTECDSSVNVIDLIDMMPSIGSQDCEWECSTGDTWSFRLLHSRLRLCVTFSRCPHIRPDTRVLKVALETIHQDNKTPLGILCVKFASETMRFFISRGCERGADVPKLVRRLAATTRLAAQWARAMHDARLRLAYKLTNDGWLALTVANTSVRCVWEVTLQLEMVVEDARSAPWPRASGVRVVHVLPAAAAPLCDAEVQRVLGATPRDWGHAPRTVWKIFKYLKHKKRDDEIL